MSSYFSFAYLNHPKNKNMIICKALLKYDYKPFSLMVVEYCSVSELQAREQYWIDTLNPNYNVLKHAFSSQGYKHTAESRPGPVGSLLTVAASRGLSLKLMSQSAILRVHAESTKESISQSMMGVNNPFCGKTHTAETLAKIVLSKSTGLVYLYNEYKELTCIFSSITLFSKLVQSNNQSIKKFIDTQDLFRGNWYITNDLINDSDIPIIQNSDTKEYKNLIKTVIECKHIRKAVYVFNPDLILLAKYNGVIETKKALNISHDTIKNYCKTGKVYDNRFIFSYHNLDLTD
jgi:group I intron endonuclease